MIKRFIQWVIAFKKQPKYTWSQYCEDNPHAAGCRIYD